MIRKRWCVVIVKTDRTGVLAAPTARRFRRRSRADVEASHLRAWFAQFPGVKIEVHRCRRSSRPTFTAS